MANNNTNTSHIYIPDLDLERLFVDYPYYCSSVLRIKSKSKGIIPLTFNSIQRLAWYGRPKDFWNPNTQTGNPIYKYTVLPEKSMQQRLINNEPIRYIILKYRQARH